MKVSVSTVERGCIAPRDLPTDSGTSHASPFGAGRASCPDTTRVLSTTSASRLAAPEHSMDEAFIRVAGATTIVNAAVNEVRRRFLNAVSLTYAIRQPMCQDGSMEGRV
jgi:hypothetical protein